MAQGFSITNCKEGDGVEVEGVAEIYVSRIKGKQVRLAVRSLNELRKIKKLFGRSKDPSAEKEASKD